MNEKAFVLDGVRRRLGDFQLQIDHLALDPGFVLGLVGRNGAGKTTTNASEPHRYSLDLRRSWRRSSHVPLHRHMKVASSPS